MSTSLSTLLQALYGSGDLQGYVCSLLPKNGLKSGWLEQGLTFKGLRSALSTKLNQSKFVQPTENLIRLMCDRGMDAPKNTGIVVMGKRGLSSDKMFVLISDASSKSDAKCATSLWTKTDNPFGLFRLFDKSLLSNEPIAKLDEPNVDYIEQLKEDSSDGKVQEAMVVTIPKTMGDEASWLKDALGKSQEASDLLLFSHGRLNETPAFALLFSKVLSDSGSILPIKDVLFASIFVKTKQVEVVLWDTTRAIASFLVFKKTALEEIAWKYLIPLWASSDDKLEAYIRKASDFSESEEESTKPVGTHSTSLKEREITDLEKRINRIEEEISKANPEGLSKQIDMLEKRAESLRLAISRISELEKALKTATSKDNQDSSSLDLFQNRLQVILTRMESLGEKLNSLEIRIRAITDAWEAA